MKTRKEGCPDGRRVMVVEDDPDIREVVQTLLEGEGFEVVTAANGLEAEEAIARDAPCVVLLDLMMPVMSGWELLRHLQAAGKLDALNVVVVSASLYGLPEHGPVAYMRKPVRVDQLIETVRRYC